jgi:hypothetical protein
MNRPKKEQSMNQKTSISFGVDRCNYMTTSGTQQTQVLNGWGKSTFDPKKLREQKQALQRSSFLLGDSTEAWGISSKLNDPTGKIHEFKGKMALKEAKELRASHINFGVDKPRYESSASSQNQWATKAAWAENRSKVTMDSADDNMDERIKNARKVNFTLGDAAPGYTSLAKDSYKDPHKTYKEWQPPKSPKDSERTEMLLDDLRGTHYTLGTDKPHFQTSQFRMNSEILKPRKKDSPEEQAEIKARKQKLVASHLCLGDSRTSYMSIAMSQQRNHP